MARVAVVAQVQSMARELLYDRNEKKREIEREKERKKDYNSMLLNPEEKPQLA